MVTIVGRMTDEQWRRAQEEFVSAVAHEEFTEMDEVAANLSVRGVANRRDAVACAKNALPDATDQEVENLADAIERRADVEGRPD